MRARIFGSRCRSICSAAILLVAAGIWPGASSVCHAAGVGGPPLLSADGRGLHWTPRRVRLRLIQGESVAVTASFETTRVRPAMKAVAVPRLEPFVVEIVPGQLSVAASGQVYAARLTLRAPHDTAPGRYRGRVWLRRRGAVRRRGRGIGNPLRFTIEVRANACVDRSGEPDGDGDFAIGANVNNHANNVFRGWIDWIVWQPVVDYSGVDDLPSPPQP